MTEEEVLRLRSKLIEKRNEILDQVNQMKSRWQDMKERVIELEEEAQKASITEPYSLLDDRGKKDIGLIDLALNKIVLGEYGICESCGDEIASKRLDALPWARLCVECARDYEKNRKTLPPTAELMGVGRLPERFKRMSGKQILKVIHEHFRKVAHIDMNRFTVAIQSGVIHLEGIVPDEHEHQFILQTLSDDMGFSVIVDHLEIGESKERRAAGSGTRRAAVLRDQATSEQEETIEEVDDEEGKTSFRAPEKPAPYASAR